MPVCIVPIHRHIQLDDAVDRINKERLLRYNRPMLAEAMMVAVLETLESKWIGQILDPDKLLIDVRAETLEALKYQIDIRGLMSHDTARKFSEEISLGVAQGSARIDVKADWYTRIDNLFCSGPCKRCGVKVPVPWNHEMTECDDCVVTEVLES